MPLPEFKTLHRAGLATDGWERLRDVLDEYVGAPLIAPTDPPLPGQSLIIDSSGNAVWGYSATGGSLGDMYAAPPSVADSLDDEFNNGDDNLQTRGFVVNPSNNIDPVAPATYLGPVDFSINPVTAMSVGQYRSSLRAGKMLVQVGGANHYFVGKQFPAGAVAFAAKAAMSLVGTAASNLGLVLMDNNSAGISAGGNNAIVNQVTGTSITFVTYQGGAITSEANLTGAQSDVRQGNVYWSDWINSGSLANVYQLSAGAGGSRFAFRNYALTGTFAPTFAGIWMRHPNIGGPNYFMIDYFRKYPSGSWFPE